MRNCIRGFASATLFAVANCEGRPGLHLQGRRHAIRLDAKGS